MIRTYAVLAEQNMSRRHRDWLVQDKVQNIADVLALEPDDYFVLKPEHSGFYESALARSPQCKTTHRDAWHR